MLRITESRKLIDCLRVFEVIEPLEQFYPDIKHWFFNKIVPGIIAGDDLLLLAEEGTCLAGVLLAKSGTHDGEKKIRCIRVLPEYQHRGIGGSLIEQALVHLGCERPLVSVPEERIHEFSSLFVNRFGFRLSKIYCGLYRPGRLEYQFNDGDLLVESAL